MECAGSAFGLLCVARCRRISRTALQGGRHGALPHPARRCRRICDPDRNHGNKRTKRHIQRPKRHSGRALYLSGYSHSRRASSAGHLAGGQAGRTAGTGRRKIIRVPVRAEKPVSRIFQSNAIKQSRRMGAYHVIHAAFCYVILLKHRLRPQSCWICRSLSEMPPAHTVLLYRPLISSRLASISPGVA